MPGTVSSFLNIHNLTAGSGDDVFHYSTGARVTGKINGGGGVNWLDYSASTTIITVNLNSTAILNVNNVLGSAAGKNKITGSAAGGNRGICQPAECGDRRNFP